MRILIMGLPGSGKTTLANSLQCELQTLNKTTTRINADEVRAQFNDWDFSYEGRIRQAQRLTDLSNSSDSEYIIVDFVAPLAEMRYIFSADYTIWMDTIISGRFEDTNNIFQQPNEYNYRVKSVNEILLCKPITAKLIENYKFI